MGGKGGGGCRALAAATFVDESGAREMGGEGLIGGVGGGLGGGIAWGACSACVCI